MDFRCACNTSVLIKWERCIGIGITHRWFVSSGNWVDLSRYTVVFILAIETLQREGYANPINGERNASNQLVNSHRETKALELEVKRKSIDAAKTFPV